jgi:hypothetical protein
VAQVVAVVVAAPTLRWLFAQAGTGLDNPQK